MCETIIKAENLKKYYENGNIKALNGIDLEIKKGEFISIIGPSGSGKSTLLNMLGALDIVDSGNLKVNMHDLKNEKNLNKFRGNEVGFIFQLHNLIPNISVIENIKIPMLTKNWSKKEMNNRANYLLEIVGLKNKAKLKPIQLSGGERQRVAIARSLANKPQIILADEPTGALDSKTSNKILKQLIKLHKEENITLIIITHDMEVAKLADRTIEILDGKIVKLNEDSLLNNRIKIKE